LERWGKKHQTPPEGSLSIWTPDAEGMNLLIQKKIDPTLKELIKCYEERYNMVDIIWRKYSDSIIYKSILKLTN